MQYRNILVHFFVPSILIIGAALTYLHGFLVLLSLMTYGSRFMTLAGAGTFRRTRYSTTIIHVPLDSILADNRTYSVLNQNYELLETICHGPALQLICFFARNTAEWIEKLYRCSLLQNLSALLSAHAGDIIAILAYCFGFPSTLAKEPPARHSAKIQKQQPKARAKAKGAATDKGKGKAIATLKTPADGPEDSESNGEDSDDSDDGENPQGCRHTHTQVMACPFYKLDPIRYYECIAKFRFTAFNHLKQHMWRKHSLTDIYCPVCYEPFKTAKLRDKHVRHESQGPCQRRSSPERFKDIEIEKLKNEVPGKLNDEQKYFWVWDQFFSAHPRPKSPYIDDGIWEPFGLLVRIAKRNITSEEFSNWALGHSNTSFEDVLLHLLTLRHEHTRISRRVALRATDDTSILVTNDTHLSVLQSEPSSSNETAHNAPSWSNFPAITFDLNTDADMLDSLLPSGSRDPGLPESSSIGNAIDLNLGWSSDIGNIADIGTPGARSPPDTSSLMEMDNFIDFDGGSQQERYQE
ncbi:hypothetical protein CSIM01_02428 [Colletotrichum simmondsii]|uniref:C2H2-type domain-containing protein n=1 Tax=Colletotrichum simmondsii TaxID=703756 RepID=A0A135S7I5_9PEZI|nr:hypothetical protein CSIM01_02428 [Colletotrichum simmondsii]